MDRAELKSVLSEVLSEALGTMKIVEIPQMFDVQTGKDRPVTQADVDDWQTWMKAFGELRRDLKGLMEANDIGIKLSKPKT